MYPSRRPGFLYLHGQLACLLTDLLDGLEAEAIPYLVEVDGSPESSQYLRNVFQRWQDIGSQTRRMTDLESGEPCIETLEWLKRESHADVFKQTVKQIIDGVNYACDEETVAWARREWDAAEPAAAPDRDGVYAVPRPDVICERSTAARIGCGILEQIGDQR